MKKAIFIFGSIVLFIGIALLPAVNSAVNSANPAVKMNQLVRYVGLIQKDIREEKGTGDYEYRTYTVVKAKWLREIPFVDSPSTHKNGEEVWINSDWEGISKIPTLGGYFINILTNY